ncbi:hypothetical protein LP421_30520 (plasmid) [Rhizobium sp. RCAM05350]|nr:hypothetical protein LP421_30520 [Rhizobium sp. RCAM05350]
MASRAEPAGYEHQSVSHCSQFRCDDKARIEGTAGSFDIFRTRGKRRQISGHGLAVDAVDLTGDIAQWNEYRGVLLPSGSALRRLEMRVRRLYR